jgi:hypothetical protein
VAAWDEGNLIQAMARLNAEEPPTGSRGGYGEMDEVSDIRVYTCDILSIT